MGVHELAEEGDVSALRHLLDATPGCVNSKSNLGDSPLHCAAYLSQTSAAKLLMERGADIHAKGDRGRTPLHCAAVGGAIDIVRLLLDVGSKLEALDDNGQTPLIIAVNHVEVGRPATQLVVDELLARGANYDLESAVLQHDFARVQELLEDPSAFNKLPREMKSILVHMSIDEPDVLDLLLTSGGDANCRTKTGAYAFAPITRVNDVKSAEILLKHRADVNSVNSEGHTRLDTAQEYGEVEMEKLLLRHGGAVTAKNNASRKKKTDW
jgi:ankyrin repeat protein